MVPNANSDINARVQKYVQPGTESDHSEDLSLFQQVPLLGIADDPPGNDSGNLYEKDFKAVPCTQ